MYRFFFIVGLGLLISFAGCSLFTPGMSRMVQDGDRMYGVTYYVGGAGQVGNMVGSVSVPGGMQDAGYRGFVEVFSWQTITAAIDQVAIDRNRHKGAELAERIRRQKRLHPNAPIHIIALSAGTAITTFALERLPEDVKVDSVVLLSSSLSSRYPMTRALRRVKHAVYVFYSPDDAILRTFVPYTGTVDRADASAGIAGLNGMRMPRRRDRDTNEQYAKVHNIRYRPEFAEAGYSGGHIDATSRDFIARYVAPLLLPDEREHRRPRPPASQESEPEQHAAQRAETTTRP